MKSLYSYWERGWGCCSIAELCVCVRVSYTVQGETGLLTHYKGQAIKTVDSSLCSLSDTNHSPVSGSELNQHPGYTGCGRDTCTSPNNVFIVTAGLEDAQLHTVVS